MAKRQKKQRPFRMTRKYQSRVEREQRQVRYITIGISAVVVVCILLLLAGLYQTWVANPAATRRAKDALNDIPAVTVNDTMISIADWQSRVRYQRQLLILEYSQFNQQILQLSQQFEPTDEYGQYLIAQYQDRVQELQDTLQFGDGIAEDIKNQMVEEQLIRQEANRRGISVTPEELQKYIEVNVFAYPYPPTPEPQPTLPPPTSSPTETVTPEPTLTPLPTPTALSWEDFEVQYAEYLRQLKDIAEMSEETWRATVESGLYYEKLVESFRAQVETSVQQITGSYILAQDRETAELILADLEVGKPFEELVQEIQAGESYGAVVEQEQGATGEESPESTSEPPPQPAASADVFDWSTLESIQSDFGEEFADVAFNTPAGSYAPVIIPASEGAEQAFLVYIQGNEVRELADYLVDQQTQDLFQTWLDGQKSGEGIIDGDWFYYIPREPALPLP